MPGEPGGPQGARLTASGKAGLFPELRLGRQNRPLTNLGMIWRERSAVPTGTTEAGL
jgi:hypothetical protein